MDSPVQWNKWVIQHFSSICDEVCSTTFYYHDIEIQLSSKNFKYLFFPFNINVKLKFNQSTKKRKKIKAKVSFKILNMNKSRHLFITKDVIFQKPNYEHTFKTGLTQDKLCDYKRGWVNSDSIIIKFMIEFNNSYYDNFSDQYDDEKSESENCFLTGDIEPSSSEIEYDNISNNNYYDFKIYDIDGQKSETQFNNFELSLLSTVQNDALAIKYTFWTNKQIVIILTFKLINFKDPPKHIPMKKTRIINKTHKSFSKEKTLHFHISYDEINDEQEGWLKDGEYLLLHVKFYFPNLNEQIINLPRRKYNINQSRNYNFKYSNNGYRINTNNNYYNNYLSYRPSYRDTSKEDTGCVGLQNQGATCYMNSLLQSLFHIPVFRKIVYKMPINDQEDIKTSIPLCLQRLFAKLQFSDESCSTKELTTSFGWNSHETFIQHDVQEFCTVLISKLSDKMKGTQLENSLSRLLGGKFKSYVRCINVDFESTKTEEFFDLSMIVKGVDNLEQSFKTYVEPEQLNGDNQYKTDQYGPQDAMVGTEFLQFPPVLHIHLRRFQFDYQTMRMTKINDRFEFPLSIDLRPYMVDDPSQETTQEENESHEGIHEENENQDRMQEKIINHEINEAKNQSDFIFNRNEEAPEKDFADGNDTANNSDYIYDLYGVLVHSGSISGGHYFAFLRTSTSPQWFKFNDSCVSKATLNEAVEDNFGGSSNYYSEKSYSAYMLVYIRRQYADTIMMPVKEDEVPSYLISYAKGQSNSSETSTTNETTDQQGESSYKGESKTIEISFYMEDSIKINSILNSSNYSLEKLKKSITTNNFIYNEEEHKNVNLNHQIVYDQIAQNLKIDRNSFRLWMFSTVPYAVFQDDTTQVNNDITLFLQYKNIESSVDISSSSPQGARSVIFIKFFHPSLPFPFNYIESTEIIKEDPISSLFPEIRNKLGLEDDEDEFLVFLQQSRFYQQIEASSTCNYQCQTLVFQLKQGIDLPENLPFHFITMEDIINDKLLQYCDDNELNEFQLAHGVKVESDPEFKVVQVIQSFKFNDFMNISMNQNAAEYYSSERDSIYADLYFFDHPYKPDPFARISFQSTISLFELKCFIARIIKSITGDNLGYNEIDYATVLNSIQIYKSANKSKRSLEPSNKPIIINQGMTNLLTEFRVYSFYSPFAKKSQNIFVQYMLQTPEIVAEKEMINVIALFSFDGHKIDKFKNFQFFGIDQDGSIIGGGIDRILMNMKNDETTVKIFSTNIFEENGGSGEKESNYNNNNEEYQHERQFLNLEQIAYDFDDNAQNSEITSINGNDQSSENVSINGDVQNSENSSISNDLQNNETTQINGDAKGSETTSFNDKREVPMNDENTLDNGKDRNHEKNFGSETVSQENNESGITTIKDSNSTSESSSSYAKGNLNENEIQFSENSSINGDEISDGKEKSLDTNKPLYGGRAVITSETDQDQHYSHEADLIPQVDIIPGLSINRIRISQIKDHVIRRLLPLDFHFRENSITRIDIISEEELALCENGATTIPVSHISDDDNLTFGIPFFVTVEEDEKFESVKKKLNDYLVGNNEMTNQEFMSLSFFFGDSEQPGLQKKLLWKDMNVLNEMRSKITYVGQSIILYILHNNKKNADMSVKIYN